MDDICRLCLSVSTDMAGVLTDDSEITYKLSCLNVRVTMYEYLPSNVCKACYKILNDIQSFHETITQNDYKLLELLNTGQDLNSFYCHLRSETLYLKTDCNYGDAEYCESIEDLSKTDQTNAKSSPTDDQFVLIHFIELDTQITVEDTVAELKEVKIGYTTEKSINTEVDPIGDINLNIPTDLCNNENDLTINNELFSEVNDAEMATELENLIAEDLKINDIQDIIEDDLENSNFSEEDAEWVNSSSNHKCLMCFEKFKAHVDLLKHYKDVHYNKFVAKCTDTDYTESSGEITEYTCKHCTKKFKKIEDIFSHLNDHKSDRPYLCKICGRTFKQVYDVLRHGRAHGNDSQLYCRLGCGYHTGYKGALTDHEKRHNKEFKYKCETCGAGFYVKTWYDQHQNIHNNVKPFVCDLCGGAFHMQRYLTSHRSALHPGAGKGVKRYVCPHCDLACYNKNGLRRHLQEHNIKKRLLCEVCGKECSTTEHLKNHTNSHLGLKPFECSTCNKKFAKKFNLNLHEKTHSGEKHLCQSCGKYFAQKSSLARHAKTRHPDIDVTAIDKE